jgi:hypothetical protein
MNSERGQSLPIAMLALAVGSLVVVPFLSHAGSSLISARMHGEVIAEQSASDAGVEHAIWSLTYGTLAEQFTQSGDEVTYQLDETLNGYDTTVTVTANATSEGGGTVGAIDKTIIDTLIFGPAGGNIPAIIHVAGNVYAIVYSEWNNDGWVKTVTITPDGMIADTAIDTLEFDNNDCYEPVITHVSGDYYAIVYLGPNNRGYLKTVSITAAGAIGNSVRSSYTFDSNACYEPDITHASGTYYAVAYRNSSNTGYVKTISISTAGLITKSIRSSLTFDTSGVYEPDIVFISGTFYAIAYRGSGNLGTLKTISIGSTGIIGTAVVSSYTFNSYSCYYPRIIQVSGSVYAISYTGASPANGDWWGGILTTVNIAANGAITKSIIDEIVFDADDGDYSDLLYMSGDIFTIVYTGRGTAGKMETISIAANGIITDAIIDKLVFDSNQGFYPHIIAIDSDTCAVVYTGSSGWVGILKTIGLNSDTGSATASYQIISTAGNTTIRAFVNTANTTSIIVSWQIE